MLLKEIVEKLNLKVLCHCDKLDQDISRGYAGDLLSDVIANTEAGDIWITMQVHLNIVAVARMRDLAAIILVNKREPVPQTLAKAEETGIPICNCELPAFELIGQLYKLGIRGI